MPPSNIDLIAALTPLEPIQREVSTSRTPLAEDVSFDSHLQQAQAQDKSHRREDRSPKNRSEDTHEEHVTSCESTRSEDQADDRAMEAHTSESNAESRETEHDGQERSSDEEQPPGLSEDSATAKEESVDENESNRNFKESGREDERNVATVDAAAASEEPLTEALAQGDGSKSGVDAQQADQAATDDATLEVPAEVQTTDEPSGPLEGNASDEMALPAGQTRTQTMEQVGTAERRGPENMAKMEAQVPIAESGNSPQQANEQLPVEASDIDLGQTEGTPQQNAKAIGDAAETAVDEMAGETSQDDASQDERSRQRRGDSGKGRFQESVAEATTSSNTEDLANADKPATFRGNPQVTASAAPVEQASSDSKPGANDRNSVNPTTSTRSTARATGGTTSTGSADGPEEPGQADRARFVQRVSRAFQTMSRRHTNGSVRLRLSPAELGSLRLEIAVRDGMMTAKVEAETQAARSLLLDNLPTLRERLAEQNIKIDRFDVDLGDRSPGGLPEHAADQTGSEERRQEGRSRRLGGGEEEDSERADDPRMARHIEDLGELNIVA